MIHGGSSGIGTTAIQLAKAFGSKVVVTAGSDEKCAECLSLGADVAINYKTQDFVEELKARAIAPDVILDMVGGDYVAPQPALHRHAWAHREYRVSKGVEG